MVNILLSGSSLIKYCNHQDEKDDLLEIQWKSEKESEKLMAFSCSPAIVERVEFHYYHHQI